MTLLRLLGQFLFLLAFVDIGFGFWMWLAGHDVTKAAGQTWFALHSASLNLAQAVTQRYLHPAVWDAVAVPLLLRPLWETVLFLFIALMLLGGLLGLVSRSR